MFNETIELSRSILSLDLELTCIWPILNSLAITLTIFKDAVVYQHTFFCPGFKKAILLAIFPMSDLTKLTFTEDHIESVKLAVFIGIKRIAGI